MTPITGLVKEFYTNDNYQIQAIEDALLTETDENKCLQCGRQLRFVYHILNFQTMEVERHGVECFKKLFDADKIVKTWDTKMDNEMASKILKNNEKMITKINAKRIKNSH